MNSTGSWRPKRHPARHSSTSVLISSGLLAPLEQALRMQITAQVMPDCPSQSVVWSFTCLLFKQQQTPLWSFPRTERLSRKIIISPRRMWIKFLKKIWAAKGGTTAIYVVNKYIRSVWAAVVIRAPSGKQVSFPNFFEVLLYCLSDRNLNL